MADPGIALTVVGIVVTVVLAVIGIAVSVWVARRRPRRAPHWTTPTWDVGKIKIGTILVPTLTVRWSAQGATTLQGVECAIQGPGGDWHVLGLPKGRLEVPKENMFTYVDLVTGRPFNSTIWSPVDHGKPVTDITDQVVKGTYRLRIRWYEPEKPKKCREKTFSYTVK